MVAKKNNGKGQPKKEHDKDNESYKLHVSGRVKGTLKNKVIADLERGYSQQELIEKGLQLLYSSEHKY